MIRKEKALEAALRKGVQIGIQMMEDKIERNCKSGKPVTANGELYWLTDTRQHLIDIMDSLEEETDIPKGDKWDRVKRR